MYIYMYSKGSRSSLETRLNKSVQYRWKYWRELSLVVGPHIRELKFGGSVRVATLSRMHQSKKNSAGTAKLPYLIACQNFQLYST